MPKILVIEDKEDVRLNLVEILQLEGFDVLSSQEGQEGIQLAKEFFPDLILCDILMPGKNGYEVLAEIRKHAQTATVPFIFLTAKTARIDMRTGMELGADDYLTKPFTIEHLLAAIRTQLKKHAVITKQLDELRVNLSLMLPHELLTPLNVILGFSSLLRDEEHLPSSDEIVKMGHAIYENGHRLQRLVQNYLLYADLKLLEYQPDKSNRWQEKSPVETNSFLADLCITPAKRSKRQHDLELNLIDVMVEVSPKALAKILEELLDNAFKFSLPGTLVQVITAVDEQSFTLTVKDQGRGMTPEQIEHVDAFMQFDRQKYEQQGQGLGLILVYRLAELNDGKVAIESIPEQGTTIRVMLPYCKAVEKP